MYSLIDYKFLNLRVTFLGETSLPLLRADPKVA